MFCSKCGKELPDEVKFCPECGQQVGGDKKEELPEEIKKDIKQTENKPSGCLVSIVGVILAFIVLIAIIDSTPETPIEDDLSAQRLLARTLCQQNVQQRMISPKNTEFNRKEDVAEKTGDMQYFVTSSGYTTNQFGAQVRFHYSCDVKITDKDHGIVSNIVIK